MQKTMNKRGFLLVVAGMLAVFGVIYGLLCGQLNESREKESALRVTLTRTQEENTEMNAKLSEVGTEDYIVSSAMTNYSFMNKDDIRFQFSNPEALYAYTEDELKILMDEMAD